MTKQITTSATLTFLMLLGLLLTALAHAFAVSE